MKQVPFLRFFFLIVLSLSLLSVQIIAGDGTKDDFGDTHPWDLDINPRDSIGSEDDDDLDSDTKIGNNGFGWSTFSMANTFSLWLYNSELISINKVSIKNESIKKVEKLDRSNRFERKYRGKSSSSY